MEYEDVFAHAIRHAVDWGTATDDFIHAALIADVAFTSGHVTSCIRTYRPEIQFSHRWVGERCQDAFYSGRMHYKGGAAVQVPRSCSGRGRTPHGTLVFVYAPDTTTGMSFPFEIDIPRPGSRLVKMPAEHPVSSASPRLPEAHVMKATVHADYRLCVPRAALEALLHKTGHVLRSGDSVWVQFECSPERVVLTLSPQDHGTKYDIEATRGRVLFPRSERPFQHGDVFPITLSADELLIDLTKRS